MVFKSVGIGCCFMKGTKMYVKHVSFPKLGFGKATEILGDKSISRLFHDNEPVSRIIFNQ